MSLFTALASLSLDLLVLFFNFRTAAPTFQALTPRSFADTKLSGDCVRALSSDIDCSPTVAGLGIGTYHPEDTLNRTCTPECGQSLAQYAAQVAQACKNQTWDGYEDTEMPIEIIPDMLRYHYNLTCLTDSGRYCSMVAAKAAAAFVSQDNAVTGSAASTNNETDLCDMCFIKNLKFQAESPYFDGPMLQEQSIYQSRTSSCGITGYALTTSTLSFLAAEASTSPSATQGPSASNLPPCRGVTYNIQPKDDCYSISKGQRIGTAWLLTDNNLQAYCANFPQSGSLCLINKCAVHTMEINDTCSEVTKRYRITESQLRAWNPIIDGGCYNLKRLEGSQICVSPPRQLPSTQSSAILQATVTKTVKTAATVLVASPPTNVAQKVNIRCGLYYTPVNGDYCNLLVMRFGISLSDFLFLNKDVNTNCTNLLADYSYCVKPVGDINTYSGRPGHLDATGVATSNGPTLRYKDLPKATYTPSPVSSQTIPLAAGTRDDCSVYFQGNRFQGRLSSAYWSSQCQLAAAVFGADVDDFGRWNYGIGDVGAEDCSFEPEKRYCGRYYIAGVSPDVGGL